MNIPVNTITTADRIIQTSGKIFYNDKRRRIELKQAVIDLFEDPTIQEDTHYMMEICMSQTKLHDRIDELSEKKLIPVLLYFVKGDKENEMPRMWKYE